MKLNHLTTMSLILVGILIIGSFVQYSVISQENGEEEHETDELERSVSIENSETSVLIESSSEREGQEDELEVEIESSSNVEFRLEYRSEIGQNETETEIRVEIFDLLEFRDGNDNGVYDGNDVDELLQTYKMADIGYNPIEYNTKELESGATSHVITITTQDSVFKVVFTIVGQFASIDGSDLKPTALKIDYIITGFNFTVSDSKLALFSEVESSTEIETLSATGEISSSEEGFVQGKDGSSAYYSWKKRAMVDGSTTDVKASYEERSATEQELYLNYEQGQSIIHDPKIGVSISGSTDSSLGVNFWPIVVTLFGMIAIFTRRR